MPVSTPNDLLKHELGDILYAEKQILKALKPMIRETSDPEMRQRLEQHQGETEQQIGNLEQAFERLGLKARAQKCPGILGILEEKKEFKEEEEPSAPMLEAFNLGAGLRVEHYEIAAYRSAMALAKSLGEREVAELLKANLEQEVAMARFIESSSSRALKSVQAKMSAEQEQDGDGAAGAGGARKRGGANRTGGASGASGATRARSGAGAA